MKLEAVLPLILNKLSYKTMYLNNYYMTFKNTHRKIFAKLEKQTNLIGTTSIDGQGDALRNVSLYLIHYYVFRLPYYCFFQHVSFYSIKLLKVLLTEVSNECWYLVPYSHFSPKIRVKSNDQGLCLNLSGK